MKKLKKLIKELDNYGFKVSYLRKIENLNNLIYDDRKKELDGYEIQIYSSLFAYSYSFNLDFNNNSIYIYYITDEQYISVTGINIINNIMNALEKSIKEVYKNSNIKLS